MQQKVIQTLIHLLFSALIVGCRSPLAHGSKEYPALVISKELGSGEDPAAESIIKPYRDPLLESMKEVIVISDSQATKGLPESALGNLVCDMLVQYIRKEKGLAVDFCFLNTGGLRIELPKGEISRSMLYELMPFENMLVIARLNGEQLMKLLDQIAERGGGPVSGIRMGIKTGMPHLPLLDGKPIEVGHIYNVLTSDYLLNGGDKYSIPETAGVITTDVLLRNALLEKFQQVKQSGNILKPRTDGRIYLVAP